jgi:hypothetical protein
LVLANASHVKNVPGRKTDINDATWLADLLGISLSYAAEVVGRDRVIARPLACYPACVLSRFSGLIFRLADRVFIPWRRWPPNPAGGGAVIGMVS